MHTDSRALHFPRLPSKATLITATAALMVPASGSAQHGAQEPSTIAQVASIVEVPFLLTTVVFAFLTALALRGGAFGRGMGLMAIGFLVMAVGHLHLLVLQWTGFNLFSNLLGSTGGNLAWVAALLVTWGCSGFGFYSLYRASAHA